MSPPIEALPRGADRAENRGGRLRALLGYRYRVPLCVPFWSPATYLAIARCVLAGRILDGPARAAFARTLSDLLDATPVVPFRSGRAALAAALRALGVRPGQEVVVPAFCCPSVATPVIAVGARPVFADAGPDLNVSVETVAAALTAHTGAVIVPSLFGNPADVPAIAALCRPRGIPVIDDAAQGLGASLDGRPVGTLGDAGVLSFGNGKICFGTGGGAVLTRDPALAARVAALAAGPDSRGAALGQVARVMVWRRWRRLTLPAGVAAQRLGLRRLDVTPALVGGMRNVDAAVALSLLATLADNLAARRQRVDMYAEALAGAPGVSVFAHRPGSACLSQVVALDSPARARAAIGRLRAGGVEADSSFAPLHLGREFRQADPPAFPRLEALAARLVELPCEPTVSLPDVGRVVAIVRASAALEPASP